MARYVSVDRGGPSTARGRRFEKPGPNLQPVIEIHKVPQTRGGSGVVRGYSIYLHPRGVIDYLST